MRKSVRLAGQRSLRYEILHDSGRRVYKDTMSEVEPKDQPKDPNDQPKGPNDESMEDADPRIIAGARLKVVSISGDVADYIDENPIADIESSKCDLDFAVNRVEDMRSQLRACYLELRSHCQDKKDEVAFEANKKKMKEYRISKL